MRSTLCLSALQGNAVALQDLCDRYENLFQAHQVDAMILFIWQDDIIGVAWFIDACSERV